jgi:hypothetical protein
MQALSRHHQLIGQLIHTNDGEKNIPQGHQVARLRLPTITPGQYPTMYCHGLSAIFTEID